MIDIVARAMASKSLSQLDDTKKYIDKIIEEKSEPVDILTYKGTVGINGTIEELPTNNVNEGDTYAVCSQGIYNNIETNVGDLFIATISEDEIGKIEWNYIAIGEYSFW